MGLNGGLLYRWGPICGGTVGRPLYYIVVMNMSPYAIWMHCIIHREQLAANKLSTELRDILQQLTLIVNYIKPHQLRSLTLVRKTMWRYGIRA
jgi:hypothetical protein